MGSVIEILVVFAVLALDVFSYNKVQALKMQITPSTHTYAKKYNVVYFVCKIDGTEKANITWKYNGSTITKPPPYDIKWSGGGVLMIRPLFVGRSDGLYECIATDKKTSVRKGFHLTVREAKDLPAGFPKFRTQPRSIFLTAGDTATFRCDVGGNPRPKLNWFLSRTPVNISNPRYTIFSNNTLQVSDVKVTDRGLFECEASNSIGRVISYRVGIFVRPKKVIIIPPKLVKRQGDVTVDPQSSYTLVCTATGKPQPEFDWYEDGVLLAGGTNGYLHLENILKSRNYTCVAKNGAKYKPRSSCRLTVRPKPLSPYEPKLVRKNTSSITIKWENNFWEDDVITGYFIKYRKRPGYYVKHLDRSKQKWNESYFVKAPTREYTLTGLKPYKFWEFRVIAVNDAGRSRPSETRFWPTGEAVPETPAWNLLGKGMSDTSFNASWSDPLIPNGRIKRYRVYYTDDLNDPLSDWFLDYAGYNWKIIRFTLTRTVYYFKVQVVGTMGVGPMSEVAVVKTQKGVPGQLKNVTAVTKSSTSALITWERPTYHGNGLDRYQIQIRSKLGGLFTKEAGFSATSYLLQRLHPFTNYTIHVVAKSFNGYGPPSEPVQCVTMEDVPSGPPQNAKARPRSSTAIEVTWSPPSPDSQNGIIVGYNIMYGLARDSRHAILSVDGSRRSAMLTGLRKFTKYSIWVSSKTSVGVGPSSSKFELFTDEDVPEGAPRNVHTYALNDSAVFVTWEEPTEKSGRIRGYFVFYLHVQDDHKIIRGKIIPQKYDAVGSQQRRAVIMKNVEPATTYQVRVAAYTLKGDGTKSNKLYVRTPKRLPPAPKIRRARLLDPTKADVRLAWRPDYPGVKQYKIVYGKSLTKYYHLASIRVKYFDVWTRSYTFENLQKGVWYCFKISAQTDKDWSLEASVWVKMPDGKPGEAPQNVRAITQSATAIRVTWDSPDPWLRRGKITKYVVSYKMKAYGETRTKEFNVIDDSARLEMIIGDLQVGTEYSFTVTAYTSAGNGPESDAVVAKTDDKALPFVRSVSVSGITSNSVVVKWVPPALSPGFTLLRYKVTAAGSKSYRDMSGIEQRVRSSEEQLIPARMNSTSFDNLKPYLYYTVSIWMQTMSGTGQRRVIQFWTKKSAPPSVEPPREVKIVDGTKVSLIVSPCPIINGDIEFYQLFVVDYGLNYQHSQLKNSIPNSMFKNLLRSRRSSNDPTVYVTAELKPNELPREVIVGAGNKIGDYENKKLTPGHTYRFFSRSYVKQDSMYVYKSSNMTRVITIDRQPTDNSKGIVDNKTNGKTGSSSSSNKTTAEEKSGGSAALIAGVVVSLFLVAGVILLVIFLRRRGCNKSNVPNDEECRKPLRGKSTSSNNGEKPRDLIELHRMKHPSDKMMTYLPIPVADFAGHVMLSKADDAEKFFQEFESIETGVSRPSEASNQPYNKQKNRYPNLFAYDHTRVVLEFTGDVGSDYFNGNFIDGYSKEKAFIATQGPMANTVADFWKACWEKNCGIIVMMTKLEERGRSRCHQYWPDTETVTYGGIRVQKIEQVELANYTKRTFEIKHADGTEARIVKHFQFTAWPDLGVPSNPGTVLSFTEMVKKASDENDGPLLVHCSAGVGRTGCFIVIYSMLDRIKYEQTVDIYGYVTMLRSQRNFMVQTDDQYIFIHDAVLDAIQSGSTGVSTAEFSSYFKKMCELNKKTDVLIEKDYDVLVCSTVPDPAEYVTAIAPANESKNRLPSILPFESNRVCLESVRGQDGSDYINASHIDGFRERGAFIAAQGPTKDTVADFWRMVMEQQCSIIVMMTDIEDREKEMCNKYWPTGKSERCHFYIIEPSTEAREPNFYIREFKVTDARDGDTRTVTQFQYINFHKNDVPVSPDGIIQMIGHVNKLKNQTGVSGPILCHSNSGVGRTGVFIALSIIFERLQVEDIIDIHQTVKALRFERAFMIQNVQQYKFCFEAVESFIKNFQLVA